MLQLPSRLQQSLDHNRAMDRKIDYLLLGEENATEIIQKHFIGSAKIFLFS